MLLKQQRAWSSMAAERGGSSRGALAEEENFVVLEGCSLPREEQLCCETQAGEDVLRDLCLSCSKPCVQLEQLQPWLPVRVD